MQNEEGQNMDLYIPRKCSATNRLITSKDHASVQINIGHLDESGIYSGHFSTFALCGFIRAQEKKIAPGRLHFRGLVEELFGEYTVILNERLNASSSSSVVDPSLPSNAGPSEVSLSSNLGAFWRSISRARRDPMATASEELSRYKSEPEPVMENMNKLDVLGWWKWEKVSGALYNARDVLSVPVYTVASESAFSSGKHILGDYRSCLTPDMLECCVVLKD